MNATTGTQRPSLPELIEKYSPFFEHVCSIRLGAEMHRGHGFKDHDLLVAQNCMNIAPSTEIGELAWLAALLHSFDRVFGADAMAKTEEALKKLNGSLSAADKSLIRDAVEKHSGKNSPHDSSVLITLRDADRIANIGPTWLIRMGQHHSTIPAMEIEHLFGKNPGSTYAQPRSCLDQLRFVIEEWPDEETCPDFGMRLPKAKEMAKKYFDFYREFLRLTETQYREAGLA